MQAVIFTSLTLLTALVMISRTRASESCVPSTGACVIGSVAAPCCLPSVCTQPATGAAYCKGEGVACTATGNTCVVGQYPYCCPQQTCQGGRCLA